MNDTQATSDKEQEAAEDETYQMYEKIDFLHIDEYKEKALEGLEDLSFEYGNELARMNEVDDADLSEEEKKKVEGLRHTVDVIEEAIQTLKDDDYMEA